MIKIVLMVALITLCSFTLGIAIEKKLKLKTSLYSAPLGFAALLFFLQICYYPVQYFNLSVYWIILISCLVLIILLVGTLFFIKDMFNQLKRKETLWVLASFLVFCFVFYHCFIDIEFSDSPMYLGYISQNINASQLNLFNLYSGLKGCEWDALYLFQGYYHFGTFLCYIINLPSQLLGIGGSISSLTISTWGLGMLYSLISSFFFVNMIRYLFISSKKLENIILFFTLFFSNFYYWRVAFSFYGNTFRTLFITMLIFMIYRWFKEDQAQFKYVLLIVVGAGITCSSSFLFISFIVLFCLAAYLFLIKKENAFIDMSIIVLPMAIYAVAMFSRNTQSPWIAPVLAIVFVLYYSFFWTKGLRIIIKKVEQFFFRYAKLIFYILVPTFFILFSIYVNVAKPEYLFNYAYYFNNHQNYDMVKDYYFIYSNFADNLLNILRWCGIILVVVKARTSEQRWIKNLLLLTLLLFLNPLTTTAVAYLIASNVFYRSVEILFNPFTEALFLVALLEYCNTRQWLQNTLITCLAIEVVIGHVGSWTNQSFGLYTFHLNGGKTVDPFLKITTLEKEAIDVVEGLIERDQDRYTNQHQPTIISHANGMVSSIPNVYQIFTTRDYYYKWNRIDWIFYDLARRHYDWEQPATEDYSRSCLYLQDYQVDYVVIEYWENPEFDQATDECSILETTTSIFKIKSVIQK